MVPAVGLGEEYWVGVKYIQGWTWPNSTKSRLLFKYKNLMITFKDDHGRTENHEKALKDPNLDEYHSIKRSEEDDVHEPKTSQNRTYVQINHEANPTLLDRQATTQHRKPSLPVMGKGS